MLAHKWASRVAVVPNAIDMARSTVGDVPRGSRTLLFCGTLNYEPNVDAILWFAREILPRLQAKHADLKVLVVGHKPSAEVTALAADPSIFVHPDVPDVRPFYEQAAIVIVPIRIAAGTRIKILEAGACRRPVVSTTIGAEGLDLTPGTNCLIADDPIDFAQRCSEILTDDGLARRLVDELHRFVKSRYDRPWFSNPSGACSTESTVRPERRTRAPSQTSLWIAGPARSRFRNRQPAKPHRGHLVRDLNTRSSSANVTSGGKIVCAKIRAPPSSSRRRWIVVRTTTT